MQGSCPHISQGAGAQCLLGPASTPSIRASQQPSAQSWPVALPLSPSSKGRQARPKPLVQAQRLLMGLPAG